MLSPYERLCTSLPLSSDYQLQLESLGRDLCNLLRLIDITQFAQQMCLYDFSNISSIKPRELMNLAWHKTSRQQEAPNVLRNIQYFNTV